MRAISKVLANDITSSVRAEYFSVGIINISNLSETIRLRHEDQNIALEDIAEMVMKEAVLLNAPIEFYTSPKSEHRMNRRMQSIQGEAQSFLRCPDAD